MNIKKPKLYRNGSNARGDSGIIISLPLHAAASPWYLTTPNFLQYNPQIASELYMLKAQRCIMQLSLRWPCLLGYLPLVVLVSCVVDPLLEVLELTVVVFQKLEHMVSL